MLPRQAQQGTQLDISASYSPPRVGTTVDDVGQAQMIRALVADAEVADRTPAEA